MEKIILAGPTWRRYRVQLGMIPRVLISLVAVFGAGGYAWFARSNEALLEPGGIAAVGACVLVVAAVMSYHSSAFVDAEAGFISIMSGFGPLVLRWKFDFSRVTTVCIYDQQAEWKAVQPNQIYIGKYPALGFRIADSQFPRYLIDDKPKSELRVAAHELGHLIDKPVETPDWAEQ